MPSLGPTGLTVSALGLGTRGHRAGLRDTDPRLAERAIAAAIEAGCQLVECGPSWGESERLVGAAVRALRARDQVVVATRVDGDRGRLPIVGEVQARVEDALRASRLEALPLVWLDGWRDAWLDDRRWPELAGTLARLVQRGDVLAWGVGVDDVGAAARAHEAGVAAVGVPVSLFDRRALATVVPAAATAGLAVIARAPLAEGALAGELAPGVQFRPHDERAAWAPVRLAALPPALAALAAFVRNPPPAATATEAGRAVLGPLRRHPELVHATIAELAIAAVLATPGVTAAVVGARTPSHAGTWWPIPPAPVPAAIATALAAQAWGEAWYGRTDDDT
ncbi:MAG: aldo/keto reductase [Myxococcales bacterium]|nr:aldo/keto reductase [Myxococcales bacterium]